MPSSTLDRTFALRARYLFPVRRDGGSSITEALISGLTPAAPLADGMLTIAGERIVAVGENLSGAPPIDLGNVALLPGLINAHTHLEFSHLAAPLGTPGMPLPEWIRAVLAARSADQHSPAAIRQGLAESVAAGTTALGEIVTSGWSPEGAAENPIAAATGGVEQRDLDPVRKLRRHLEGCAVTLFQELIGLSAERAKVALAMAREHLDAWQSMPGIQAGLSPHAPYTVHPELLAGAVELARQRGCPVAMHVAESREELELLAAGSGPCAELLRERDVWQPGMFGNRNVGDILRALATAPRALVIHGNYLGPQDIDFLAERAGHMTVVYCPRTHAYFRHEPYPLARLLSAGVQVAVGTDSRASNPDLSLLAELRFVAEHHPAVSGASVLELGTLAGATALGMQHEAGTLAPGKLANLAVVALPDADAVNPHELLFHASSRVVQTWLRGEPVISLN